MADTVSPPPAAAAPQEEKPVEITDRTAPTSASETPAAPDKDTDPAPANDAADRK
jgi:hypothetical protein